MNIVFLTRRFYPQIGGVERHVLELSRQLLKQGHNVTIITEASALGDNPPDKYQGIKILNIHVGKEGFFKKFKIWKEIFKLRKIIKCADIVHCHDVFFWYLPLRFIYPSKQVFTTFHGYEATFPVNKKAILIRKLSALLSWGNIAVGDYIAKYYGTKADYTIYGGVSRVQSPKLKAKSNNSKLKIVFLGRINSDTGIVTYLNTLDLLKKNKIRFYITFVGDGKHSARAKKYGKVTGFKKNIDHYIKDADVVFSSSYLSILESLIRKKIIIAVYDNPLKEDYLKLSPFYQYIYVCSSPDEVYRVVKSIKDSPWKSESMIENAYKWAKNQTWNDICKIYLKLWKE